MLRRSVLLAPLVVAGLGGAAFWTMLRRMARGQFDPHGVPSPLVGQIVPAFTLPPLPGAEGFDAAALRSPGGPVLVNFFASWCLPCAAEADTLAGLGGSNGGPPLWGVAYKDAPAATARFLARTGNPFARCVSDRDGRVGIDWGITGVPESFLVDRHGVVRWHWAGPLDAEIVDTQLRPALRRAA